MGVAVENALISSQRAINFDKLGNVEAAIYYYGEAVKYLEAAISDGGGNGDEISKWKGASSRYKERIRALENLGKSRNLNEAQSKSQQMLQRCNFLFSQALDADERGHKDIAVDLYSRTAEFALLKKAECDEFVQPKLMTRATQAIERAEEIKGITGTKKGETFSSHLPKSKGEEHPTSKLHRGSSAHLKISGGSTLLSDDEKHVLLVTSKINSIDYVPFMDIDLRERFQYAVPFTDRDGNLKLSFKQKVDFSKWCRPEEIHSEPKMIFPLGMDFHSIKQTIISDCSFVASLAVSALYERRFNKKLISTIIYPRNKSKEPIYNPFGKYMIKLHLNGVPRKIVIDDTLPVGRHGELLCSYSTNSGELWVSLLEKAYMKVMGGYDFPGSNSNIDLHALTGWIPERMAIRKSEEEFNATSVFNMLEERYRNGHCLGTVATGTLSDVEAERTGLVPTHAYAILNIKTVKGIKLMQLKNPWSHVRWRGNYSELDVVHWTPDLRSALNFDPESASMFDNGIFWIDYESILNFFDVFYINWNPELFSYTYCIHRLWQAGIGPAKDAYNIGENPQFKLHIPGDQLGSVWVLLTRHITDVEDFKDNQEFITLLVYKTSGKRVYYPRDPAPFIDGVRINSPHYLCKIVLTEDSDRTYTLVISQYEKMHNIYYTLRAYSTLPFTLNHIDSNWNFCQEITGQWSGASAGGCANYTTTYGSNPCYQFKLESNHNNNSLLVVLKGPRQYQIGFDIEYISGQEETINGAFGRKSSGPYRSGFVVLELGTVPGGIYRVTPSTYYPGSEGPFILTVKSTSAITLTQIK
ncbi:hypothetical protein RUM43_014163 [Polyplax serrata]|uniref:Calpain catalytic domain-containing protein n=1 Tax=Polyplax serrata TaxID=468196 RepID=A0AAN8NJ64_POLSC